MDSNPCKIYYCYKATNQVTEKVYIGFAADPQKRWRQHKADAIKKRGFAFHAAIRKYGWENFRFEIICCGRDKLAMLEHVEPALIEQYQSSVNKNGYNMLRSSGGAVKRDINPLLGRPRSEETKRKIRETKAACPYRHTPETKEKMIGKRLKSIGSKKFFWIVTDSKGGLQQVRNLDEFCRKHSIRSHSFHAGKLCKGYSAVKVMI